MKAHFITMALYLAALSSFAQQEIMHSQYIYNGLTINPALAGIKNYTNATFLHREQWVDFEGAPTTESFTLNGPVLLKNVGLGLILENDKIGATSRLNIYGSYAYHLNFGFGKKLSLGMQGGVTNYSYSYSEPSGFRVWDTEDPVFMSDKKISVPNFGVGIYYQHFEKFYAGVSTPRLIDYRMKKNYSQRIVNVHKEQRHYYFNSGYTVSTSYNIKIKPSFMIKYVSAAPIQTDFNLLILYSDAFTLGCSYRTGDAIIVMMGLQLNKRLRIGYSYDITLSNLKNYSSNTHEILIGYDFINEIIKMKTPRFF